MAALGHASVLRPTAVDDALPHPPLVPAQHSVRTVPVKKTGQQNSRKEEEFGHCVSETENTHSTHTHGEREEERNDRFHVV